MMDTKEKIKKLYAAYNDGKGPKDHLWLAEELRKLDAEEK